MAAFKIYEKLEQMLYVASHDNRTKTKPTKQQYQKTIISS